MLISLILVCVLLFLVIYYFTKRFNYFVIRHVPGPPISSIIFGHLNVLLSVKSFSEQLRQWTKQYGHIYGIFEGTCPIYVVSDVEFIEEVLIKQFSRFHARRATLVNRSLGKQFSNVLSANIMQLWKKHRKILNPAFSSAKMKRLLPTIENCTKIFLERLSSVDNQSTINIYQIYKRLTMDVICQCAFSIDTEVQYDFNNTNIYMKKIEEFFSFNFERTFLARIHRILPWKQVAYVYSYLFRLKEFYLQNQSTSNSAQIWLLKNMNQFVQQRFTKSQNANDFFQLMIDATRSDNEHLSSTQVFSNAFIILIAGYETTSTALAYCTYRLAKHQQIQQKLYEEIREHLSTDESFYDIIMHKLTYLDLFIKEVLRMHPIAIQVMNRQCTEDTYVKQVHIQQGTFIQIDVLSVHFNEQLWGPQPVDEFHPERHSIKRHPLAFMPFGGGPRTCIGMRFALSSSICDSFHFQMFIFVFLVEMKSCLAQLISKYKILPSFDQNIQLKTKEEIVIAPEQIPIQLQKRSLD